MYRFRVWLGRSPNYLPAPFAIPLSIFSLWVGGRVQGWGVTVVRSTFSASMRVYFTAKAFTNEWMSASKKGSNCQLLRSWTLDPHSQPPGAHSKLSSSLRLWVAFFLGFWLFCDVFVLVGKK